MWLLSKYLCLHTQTSNSFIQYYWRWHKNIYRIGLPFPSRSSLHVVVCTRLLCIIAIVCLIHSHKLDYELNESFVGRQLSWTALVVSQVNRFSWHTFGTLICDVVILVKSYVHPDLLDFSIKYRFRARKISTIGSERKEKRKKERSQSDPLNSA